MNVAQSGQVGVAQELLLMVVTVTVRHQPPPQLRPLVGVAAEIHHQAAVAQLQLQLLLVNLINVQMTIIVNKYIAV
jgi:hypothetical protein